MLFFIIFHYWPLFVYRRFCVEIFIAPRFGQNETNVFTNYFSYIDTDFCLLARMILTGFVHLRQLMTLFHNVSLCFQLIFPTMYIRTKSVSISPFMFLKLRFTAMTKLVCTRPPETFRRTRIFCYSPYKCNLIQSIPSFLFELYSSYDFIGHFGKSRIFEFSMCFMDE